MFTIACRCMVSLAVVLPLLLLSSCCRSSRDVWDDTKTCGRHMARGFSALGGSYSESRQIRNRDEFMPREQVSHPDYAPLPEDYSSDELAFVHDSSARLRPLPTATREDSAMLSGTMPSTTMPSIEAFRDPSSKQAWRAIFSNIRFDYNSDLVKSQESLATIKKAGSYLREHSSTRVILEGHCDERGAEAYNVGLSSRRAHAVRGMLLAGGASPEQLQVIPYGKERPLDPSHTEEAWSKNRRVEFKIYE